MSGYGKDQEQYVYDAAATRPCQVASYPGYAQPSFASQYTDAQARVSHEQPPSADIPYISPPSTESRAATSYQAQYPFIDARSRHLADTPELCDTVTPAQGTAGSKLLLHIRAKYDLTTDSSRFVFMFGSKACVAELQKIDQVGEYFNYTLSVDVPPFSSTQSSTQTMLLQLRMEDEQGRTLSQAPCGDFTYTDFSPSMAYKTSPDLSRTGNKRKYSSEYSDYADTVTKRANVQRLQAKPRSSSNTYSLGSHSTVSPLPSFVQPSLPTDYGYTGGYGLTKQPQQASYSPQLPQKALYAVPSGMGLPQAGMKAPSPSLPTYNPYAPLGSHMRSPAAVSTNPARSSVIPSPSSVSTPTLIRTSTLQPPSSTGGSSGQAFNPYLMYPSKAVLKIEGDLDSMSDGWTAEELEAKRRLVQFKRSQSGSTITTSFSPVTPETRSPNSICVSCILWEEKQECFITSVDTIFLLEALVNVRFTVEEKNRIRRNLEGFHPLTVSKAKADSEEFFKVIMGFPNPKPRNIEKDVKVFSWKTLAHALKKIISKYSASYSSTAGVLPAPISNSYGTGGGSVSAAFEAQRNASPHSVASSAASKAYGPNLTTSSLSPNMKTSQGLEGSGGHGDLRGSIPQLDPTGQGMGQWVGTGHHQVPQYSTALGGTGRGSWDYGAYLDPSGPTGMPSAAQSLQLHRTDVTTDLSQLPGDSNAYQQYGQRTTRV